MQTEVKESGFVQKVITIVTSDNSASGVEKLKIPVQARLLGALTSLCVNLITNHPGNQQFYFSLLLGNTELVNLIFNMSWDEHDDEDFDSTELGEIALRNLLIFIYNCTIKGLTTTTAAEADADADAPVLFTSQFIDNLGGASILYRVHRYLYVSEECAREEDSSVSKGVEDISEWYTRIMKAVLAMEKQGSPQRVLIQIYNAYISKKDKEIHEIIVHEPSGGLMLLKKVSGSKNEVLKISKDQLLLTSFLKSTVEEAQKNPSAPTVSMETCECLMQTFLNPLVMVFSAYYTEEKVLQEIYMGPEDEANAIREVDLLDFLELIQQFMEILIRVTAFGDNAPKVREFIASWEECAVLAAIGSLMHKLKTSVDFLVHKDFYRPQVKFKETLGLKKEEEKKAELPGKPEFVTTHPFAGHLSTIVCLMGNLVYQSNPKTEAFLLTDRGWSYIGLILAHTKLDIDNPTLREWCLLFIRNITSWSDKVRDKLKALTMVDSKTPYDPESQKTFDAMGAPMQEMFSKEMDKYKKDEQDQ